MFFPKFTYFDPNVLRPSTTEGRIGDNEKSGLHRGSDSGWLDISTFHYHRFVLFFYPISCVGGRFSWPEWLFRLPNIFRRG